MPYNCTFLDRRIWIVKCFTILLQKRSIIHNISLVLALYPILGQRSFSMTIHCLIITHKFPLNCPTEYDNKTVQQKMTMKLQSSD